MSQSHRRLAIASVVLVLALSGCASAGPVAPGASGTPASAPSPTPTEAAVTELVVGATSLVAVDESGDEAWTTPYTSDPAEAVARLSELFASAPETVDRPGDATCDPADTQSAWEGFELSYNTDFLPEGQLFQVTSTAPLVGGITVRTPQGPAVGSPIAEFAASLPAEQVGESFDFDGVAMQWVDYEVGGGEYRDPNSDEAISGDLPEYWGAKARSLDGTVELLHAPTVFVSYC